MTLGGKGIYILAIQSICYVHRRKRI